MYLSFWFSELQLKSIMLLSRECNPSKNRLVYFLGGGYCCYGFVCKYNYEEPFYILQICAAFVDQVDLQDVHMHGFLHWDTIRYRELVQFFVIRFGVGIYHNEGSNKKIWNLFFMPKKLIAMKVTIYMYCFNFFSMKASSINTTMP